MPHFTQVVLFTDSTGRARFREEPIALDQGTRFAYCLSRGVGIRDNYDGAGSNARDNNTLYLEAWIVF